MKISDNYIKDNMMMTDKVKKHNFRECTSDIIMSKVIFPVILIASVLLIGASGSIADVLILHPSGTSTGDTVTYNGSAATDLDTNDSAYYGFANSATNDYYLAIDDHIAEIGTITSVTVKAYARRSGSSGSSTFTIGLKTNGSNYLSGSKTSSSTTYALYSGSAYLTNPQSGAAWTWSEIDSLVAIIDHTNSTAMRTTELYVEVNYVNAAATLTLHPSGTSTGDAVTYNGSAATDLDTNDTTYYGASSGTGNDYYLAMDDHTTEAGTITSVVVKAYIRYAGSSGSSTFTIGLKTNGSNYLSGSQSSSSTTYALYAGTTYATNPQSGAAWTWSEIDSLVAVIDHTNATAMRTTELYTQVSYIPCTDPDPSTITIPAGQTVQGDPYNVSGMYSTAGDVEAIEYKVTETGEPLNFDWGKTNAGVSTAKANFTRLMSGTAPSSTGMVLKSISVYVGANHGDQMRLAVYSGGSLSAGPAGATLLYDFGQTSGSGTDQWLTLTYSGPDISVPANQPLWIALKSNGGGTGFSVVYSSSATGSNFQSARGRYSSTSVSTDNTISYPATWPAGTGSFTNYWYSVYITYSTGSGSVVCTDWTSGSSMPASTGHGSNCGDYISGSTYTLDVRGTDPDCGEYVTTTARDFTWLSCEANAPDDLSPVIIESDRVVLQWTAECTGNEYYKVYRDGIFLANVDPCDGTYEDAAVTDDTDYSYTVRGYSTDEPCESIDSSQVNVRTLVYETRTTPGFASVAPADSSIYVSAPYTEDSDNDNTILVEWGMNLVDYSLGSQVVSHVSSPYIYQITGLTNEEAYQIKVTYQDSDGFTGGTQVQVFNHVDPFPWSDDTMLHNSNRFTGTTKWGGDWGTPSGQYGGFTCETCHAMSTTNIKRIKEAISAPAGTFPGSQVIFEETGAGGFGDDTTAYTSSNKICEICHSKTLYHKNNSPTIRTHESEPAIYDCTYCHAHEVGFKPDGACTICHAIAMGNRVAVTGQFSGNSHHVQGVAVTEQHCYQCHWEANSDGSVNQTYHGGSLEPDSEVNLIIYGNGLRPSNYVIGVTAVEYHANGSRAQILEINQHCLGCHNAANNATQPFGDGKTPKQYSWDGYSINDRYTPEGTTSWGKYSGANTNGKAAVTKAFSSHGVADVNQQGWDLNETWTDTSGTVNVACFDCHNSHGSTVSGVTTSYTSATTSGGILKDTTAGKGGYAMTYKPEAGGSAGNKNVYNPGAAICFDCHETANAGTTPWGYQGTYGATQPIKGYLDSSYLGAGSFGPQQRYAFKAGAGANKGGHLGASASLNTTPTGTINGLCTHCHDPHGVSPSLNQQYAVPMLKGTWMTSPYREDTAPSVTNEGRGGGDKVNRKLIGSRPGYNIDQNTFTGDTTEGKDSHTRWNFSSATKITENDTDFAGLCLNCHAKASIDPDGANTWKTYDRIHDTVKGWAQSTGGNANNTMHAFTCSKCHSPHNSARPRLMVTNCLNDNHRGGVASGATGGSGSGIGEDGAGRGRFPGGGGGYAAASRSDAWNSNTGGAYYFGNVGTNGTRQPAYRACHDSQPGNTWTDQKWNDVTQW
jgi:hypothetical protein